MNIWIIYQPFGWCLITTPAIMACDVLTYLYRRYTAPIIALDTCLEPWEVGQLLGGN